MYKAVRIEEGYRADIVVEERVVVELKSAEVVLPDHNKQLLTYLRLLDARLGLLINVSSALIRNGITRVVNKIEE